MPGLDDATRQLLEKRQYAILGTQDDDGALHLTPVWYVFENDMFYVGSNSSSRKVKNAAARPTGSLVVDVRRPGVERWVAASGTIELLRDEDSREVNARILRRYLTREALEDPKIGPAFAAVDDVTLCLSPRTWRSWAAAEVDRQFFGGILGANPERWFLPIEP